MIKNSDGNSEGNERECGTYRRNISFFVMNKIMGIILFMTIFPPAYSPITGFLIYSH